MAQDLPQGGPEDEAREEDIVDRLIRDQEAASQSQVLSTEGSNVLEDLGYKQLKEIPRPHNAGDWADDDQGIIFEDQESR